MKIKILSSQFGLEENKIYEAEDYGVFYLVLIGSVTFEIEKVNAEEIT